MAGRWVLVIALAASLAGCWGADPEEEISFDPSKMPAALPEVEPSQADWPWWRGPNRDNISPTTGVPTEWDEDTNILWKTKVPGRGHASPTTWGNRIFLATAYESAKTQSVVCYDKETGKSLWETEVHTGGISNDGHHRKSSFASCTIACDGERVFASFLNDGSVWLTALSLDGKPEWSTEVGKFVPEWGYNPSPAIYKSFVIVAADHKKGGYIAAIHRKTGDTLWRKNRPAESTYASPLIANVGGQDQLLIAGANLVASYNPANGEQLWEASGTTTAVASTMAAEGDFVVASGGYPGSETLCLDLDGAPDVVWKTNQKSYVPSLLIHQGTLYQVHDNGRMSCLDLKSGEKLWQGRLSGGDISASPVYADGHIFIVNEAGNCFVVQATREKFRIASENQLGDEAFATPAIVDGRIYLRAADSSSGSRQEYLYCIANQ
jgi:outer membrane protein assembly factor BamB